MVVRISNRYCYTQIAWATLKGDRILCQATSQELPKYSLPGDEGASSDDVLDVLTSYTIDAFHTQNCIFGI